MMRFIQRLHRKGAWTLFELIMAIIVIGIVSVPLSMLIFQHFDSSFLVDDLTNGYHLAQLEMETVKNIIYTDLSIGTTNTANYRGYPYDLRRIVSFIANNPPDSLKEITVEIRKAGDTDVIIRLITRRTGNVTFGS